MIGGLIAQAPQRFEETYPQITEIGNLGSILLKHVAVVANPFVLATADKASRFQPFLPPTTAQTTLLVETSSSCIRIQGPFTGYEFEFHPG